ncbi:ATP-binding protein [Propionivibrio sp.]|uniref:two-component system sensor histidine kinase NtrB n=1 Tax=Propionivibrio sp. TaxID=2212460 RepID=UPI0025ED806F|nr:ATP-binding protein [Propionivibrio sp.]MBK7357254.1 PAS domain S-box protein [Propionivibrio sp.]MBK8401349.1 PAS domain S-box protein [Propionivibrio sp.]MBK8745981.1 PAS domain S-box protein [Propionivibrio sp.]MBK8892575.1 PAS domain S-box protein [Propionivibrio sp.]MBL0208702.1 PAS domain S-box protein [Propionivibrio sp.]
MSTALELAALPLIAFSARVSRGELEVLRADGGMLELFTAGQTAPTWLNQAMHANETAAFLAPPEGESRQLVRLRDTRGAWHWFNLRIGDLDRHADALCYTALLTDATEFKAMEEVAQRYRDYTEITSDWYWETDAEHRFSYFSREFEEVSGVPSASVLGKTRWDGIGKERLGNIDWEAHKQLMFDQKPFRNFEYPGRRADGRIFWFRISGRPRYDDGGKFLGYYGIAADITTTRRIEERLQQSERLASIGQLAAGVAHEINNPLSFIRSNVETLGEYLSSLLVLVDHYAAVEATGPAHETLTALQAAKEKADLDFVRQDAPALLDECRNGLERVRKIVADLREFSREGDTDWSEVDIHTCLESAINLVVGGLPSTIRLERRYAKLPTLRCKPLQLNQVFLALLRNAALAIGDHPGTITASSGQNDQGELWFEIADTGVGIAPENLPRLFEPFFTTRKVGQGTGMGLSMCFGIVADHGGRIEVQSTPGAGASFRVTLPQNTARKNC